MSSEELHPRIRDAAGGELPPWARAGDARRAHMERVAMLMGRWAEELGVDGTERLRWLAAARLHDALRDASPVDLRSMVPSELEDLPEKTLHGPAAAAHLRDEGVRDQELLHAVAYHTFGHPELGRLGRALYAADFLEPGRRMDDGWVEDLRTRMPGEMDAVCREIVARAVERLEDDGRRVRPETRAFHQRLREEG